MKGKKNIVLTGMPGASKTSVGRVLSRQLGMMFMDTDAILEYEYSMPVSEFIAACGEDYFRRQESKVVERLDGEDIENILAAVGGGAVLSEENRRIIKNNAVCVWLKAKPLTLYDRLKGDEVKRPLLEPLSVKKISSVMNERRKFYEEVADFEVDTDALTVEETAEYIRKLLSEE